MSFSASMLVAGVPLQAAERCRMQARAGAAGAPKTAALLPPFLLCGRATSSLCQQALLVSLALQNLTHALLASRQMHQ